MVDRPASALWILTGPSGGGKSTAAEYLDAWGAEVIDADRVGHEVLLEPEVMLALQDRFGSGILHGAGIDRARLGELVFGDPEALAALEAVVHPILGARLAAKLASCQAPLAVVEAAVYFRLPAFGAPDHVILVTANEEIRRRRLMAKTGLTEEEITKRLRSQRPLLKDWRRADIVLTNEGGPAELIVALQELLRRYFPAEEG